MRQMKFRNIRSLPNRTKQAGYTVLELGVAIAAALAFVGVIVFGVMRSSDNSKYNTLVQIAQSQMTSALVSCQTNGGTLQACTPTASTATTKGSLEKYGVTPQTPWGTFWTVQTAPSAAQPNQIVIDFPVGGNSAPEKLPAIATRLAAAGGIIAAATPQPNAANPTALRVTYNPLQ